MFRERDELKCCSKTIPWKVVTSYGGLEKNFLQIYAAWLDERHAANPLYCPHENCRAFIHQVCTQEGFAKCPFCKKQMCVICKQKEHPGTCKGDKKLAAMIKENHWQFCPKCGHLVERMHGCNHMRCVCGANFCYRCGLQKCDCGVFQDAPT